MKRRLLILALLFCAPAMWATCTAGTNGQWETGGNWTGTCTGAGGVPGAADPVAVASHNMTCGDGTTATACDFLTLAMTGTTAITVANNAMLSNHCVAAPCVTSAGTSGIHVQSGGTFNFGSNLAVSATVDWAPSAGQYLTIDNGGRFNWTGSIAGNGWTGNFNGHSVCTPNGAGTVYQDILMGSGDAVHGTLTFQGSSSGWPATTAAVFETYPPNLTSNNCWYGENASSAPHTLVRKYAIFNGCGDSTHTCGYFPHAYGSGSLMSDDTEYILENAGGASGSLAVYSAPVYWNAVDVRGSLAATPIAISSSSATTPTAARTVTNLTVYNPSEVSGSAQTINLQATGLKVGLSTRQGDASNTPGALTHNVLVVRSDVSGYSSGWQNVNSYLGTANVNSGTWFTHNQNAGATVSDMVVNSRHDNLHIFVAGGVNSNVGINKFVYNVGDANNYYSTDTGEWCHGEQALFAGGGDICSFNLWLNGGMNIAATQTAGPSLGTIEHSTIYKLASFYYGDNTVGNQNFASYQYNFQYGNALPTTAGSCVPDAIGMVVGKANASSPTAILSQIAFTENYNGYFAMTNSGDPGATTCANVSLPAGKSIGGVGLWVGLSNQIRGGLSAQTVNGFSSNVLTCNACDFNQGGGSPCTISTGATPSSNTDLCTIVGDQIYDITNYAVAVVSANNCTATPCHDITVTPISGVIGVGHTFTVYKSYQSPGYIYGTDAHFGLNDLHANMNFFNPGKYVCDWYNLVTGNANNCALTDDTNVIAVSKAMVQVNGWDYGSGSSLAGTNCNTNCPVYAAPNPLVTPMNALSTIRQWYTPYNGMFSNADCRTQPCQWTGSQTGYNPAINSN